MCDVYECICLSAWTKFVQLSKTYAVCYFCYLLTVWLLIYFSLLMLVKIFVYCFKMSLQFYLFSWCYQIRVLWVYGTINFWVPKLSVMFSWDENGVSISIFLFVLPHCQLEMLDPALLRIELHRSCRCGRTFVACGSPHGRLRRFPTNTVRPPLVDSTSGAGTNTAALAPAAPHALPPGAAASPRKTNPCLCWCFPF
jgi:hypothetical protein